MGNTSLQGSGVSEDQGQLGASQPASQPLIPLHTFPSLRIFFFPQKNLFKLSISETVNGGFGVGWGRN